MTNDVVRPLKANRVPLPVQTQQYLLSLVERGVYEPGEQLPSENELATQLGISRPTLREALLNLEQEGVVVRKHGVGTFIAHAYEQRLVSGLERLESILELAARQGMELEFTALEVQEEPAGAYLAQKLQVAPGTSLTTVRRVIAVDGTPVAYMDDAAPADQLSVADIDQSFNGSVLDLLREKQRLQVGQVVADIIACNSGEHLAAKLGLEVGQAILMLEETLYDQEGTVVEFSRNYFVPEHFRFRVVRR
jgi:GntR family transcriptional regulator